MSARLLVGVIPLGTNRWSGSGFSSAGQRLSVPARRPGPVAALHVVPADVSRSHLRHRIHHAVDVVGCRCRRRS